MHRFPLLFRVSPVRASLETLALVLLSWALFSLFLEGLLRSHIPVGQLVFLMGTLGMSWCALRLRRFLSSWWGRRLQEALLVVILCLPQAAILLHVNSPLFHLSIPLQGMLLTVLEFALLTFFLFFANYTVFLIVRLLGRFWSSWNRLRRTSLQWSLTHAHALVVAFGTLLLMLLAACVLAFFSHGSFARLIIPIFTIVAILGALTILAVIPPSALFSYVVVRQTVHRIQILASATSALRSGNYSIRVPVLGEDEVAQLQTDFNAMASDLERVMRELQLERDTVTALLNSRRELVANASHELRTPVATLRGYLESTLLHWDDLSNSALQQDFVVMEHEVLHLQTLVEDLFSLARADIGRLSLRCEPTDIASLVEHIVAVRAPLAWLVSKIELVADLPSDLPCAQVDATYMELILQNLLHIALSHTPPGGIVAVVVALKDSCVLIQVKDTGPCLSSGDLAATSDSLSPDGSVWMLRETGGLGLALVKQWTESMGGQFILESIAGEGSCFQVCFPSTIGPMPGALIEAC